MSLSALFISMTLGALPVIGYSISIDRSDLVTDDVEPYYEEIVEIRAQNNKDLSETQIDSARDAGVAAACQPGEDKLLDRISFYEGKVVLEVVCIVVDS